MFLLQPEVFWWDLTILMGLTLSLSGTIGAVFWAKQHPQARFRKWLTRFVALLLCIACCIGVYGSFIEPQFIMVRKAQVSHPLAQPLSIAIVSDYHLGPYKGRDFVERSVRQINRLLPDLVIIPGDFIYTDSFDLNDLEPLKDIQSALGVYAVLGNHDAGELQTLNGVRYQGEDYSEQLQAALELNNITVLRNDNERLELADGTVVIAGIEDLWTNKANVETALVGVPNNAYVILASHNPSVIQDEYAENAHLIISGHTHGGQIRIPGIDPLFPLPTSIGPQYDQGVFSLSNDRTLIITRGIGESSPRARLFAWPEILLLEVGQRR